MPADETTGRATPDGGPLVSVVIATYNYAHLIGAAIQSVRAQTWPAWECIVVDDGSTDDTAAVLAGFIELDPRIRAIAIDNSGPSGARNVGIRAARGELVQLLDADDELAPWKLERQVERFRAEPETEIVFGSVVYFDDAHPEETRSGLHGEDETLTPAVSGPGSTILPLLVDHNIFPIEAPLVRRSVFERVGEMDPSMRRMEDWDLWLRCAIAGCRFLFDPGSEGSARIRVHGSSASRAEIPMVRGEITLRRLLRSRLGDPALRELNEAQLRKARIHLATLEAIGGDARAGLQALLDESLRSRDPKLLARTLVATGAQLPGGRPLLRRLQEERRRRRTRRGAPAFHAATSIAPTGAGELPADPRILAAVINYRGIDQTLDCVRSLTASDYANLEVIVVDNASPGDEAARLRAQLPGGVGLIESPLNGGYGAGANLAIRRGLEQGADAVWILNNDTLIEPDTVRLLAEALAADPRFGVLSPVIAAPVGPEAPDGIWFAGGELVRSIASARHLHDVPATPEDGQPVPTGFITGCAMLLSTRALRQVGGFWEDFFLYWEDVELSLRMREAGWLLGVAPAARITHLVHGSIPSATMQRYRYRNALLTTRAHGSATLTGFVFAASLLRLARGWAKALLRLAPAPVAETRGVVEGSVLALRWTLAPSALEAARPHGGDLERRR